MTEILPSTDKVLRGFFWKSTSGLKFGSSNSIREVDPLEALQEIGALLEDNEKLNTFTTYETHQGRYRVIKFFGGDNEIVFEFESRRR